jgi:hypothetical protein
MNLTKWYRIVEALCQFLFVGSLVYACVQTGGVPTAPQLVQHLPVPLTFLASSLIFKLFGAQFSSAYSMAPLIKTLSDIRGGIGLSPIQILIAGIIVLVGCLAAIKDNSTLKDVLKFLLGLFAGTKLEPKRSS